MKVRCIFYLYFFFDVASFSLIINKGRIHKMCYHRTVTRVFEYLYTIEHSFKEMFGLFKVNINVV